MKLWKKIIFIAIISIVALFALVILSLSIAKQIVYADYVKNKEIVCKIPGLSEGYVPQGLCYVDDKDTYIFTGYNEDYLSIYVVKDNNVVELISVEEDGERTKSHGGGVTCVGEYVYIVEESGVQIFKRSDILNGKDGGKVTPVDKVQVEVKPSCTFNDDKYIYFAEFHDGNKYVADPAHTYVTPAGDENHAFVVAYKLSSDGSFDNEAPEYFISVKDKVQGFVKSGDVYALSTSYGLSSSHLTLYKEAKDSGKTVAVGEKDIPLYYLDSSNMTKDVLMPAFSEDMDIVDGRIIVSFESACNKYIVGKFFFANKVISYPLDVEE